MGLVVRVHLQGFGWVGAYLALRLSQEGHQITWEDNDSPYTAWRASTGCIYPSGDEWEMQSYVYWLEHPLHHAFMCFAPFWYGSKGSPHSGRWRAVTDLGALRRHRLPTLHVNVQAFVEYQRDQWRHRRQERPEGALLIRGAQPTRYMWGWSAKARLNWRGLSEHSAPCIYLKPNKFETLYAYPAPNEQTHYVGSAMIAQREPRKLKLADKILRWEDRFESLTGGLAYVEQFTEYRQGWRPYGPDEAWNARRLVARLGESLEVYPMRHSGVRLAPALWDAVSKELQ